MNERHAKWHQMTAQAVCAQLHTDAACGLSRKAARSRFKKEGANTVFDRPRRGIGDFIRPLLIDPACLLMLFATLLSLCFAAVWQGIAVILLILSMVSLCFRVFQKALQTEERISKYRVPSVRVIREGKRLSISARRVVAGDILLLREGDIVPCDCRLMSGTDLRVLTLMRDQDGKTSLAPLPKNAETVYTYGTPDMEPYYENMLFGASEILFGEARAIAVETGETCYVASLPNFTIPAEMTAKQTEKQPWSACLPYIRLYGFGMLILLAILCVLSVFRLPSEYGIADIFLSLCVLTGCASPAILELWFKLVDVRGRVEAMESVPKENRAVFKSERGMERLRKLTDIVVVGHLASSDGIEHFSAAAIGSGLIYPDKEQPQPLLQPLCEAFFLLKMAEEGLSVTLEERGDDDTALLEDLVACSGLDLSALQVRLVRTRKRPDRSYGRMIDVEMREREFSLCFSEDSRVLLRCMLYEDEGRLAVISPRLRDQLQTFCKQAVQAGGKAVTVLRFHPDGTCSLVGVVAMREREQQILPSVLEELNQSGVRTTFFLTGDPVREAAYATAYRLPTGHLIFDGEHPVSAQNLEEARVLIGYPIKDLESLLQQMRRAGRRVALLCGGVGEWSLLKHASLLIACDPTQYDGKNAEESALEQLPVDGKENSARCAQVIRRRADLLIHRATAFGGGLSTMLRALSIGRATKLRMRWLLSGLAFSQALTLTVTLLAVLFGLGLPGGMQMLYAAGFAELVFAMAILTLRIPQYLLRKTPSLDADAVEALIFSRQSLVLLALIGALTVSLYAAILTWCGVIDAPCACTYLFCSLILGKVGQILSVPRDVMRQNRKLLLILVSVFLLPVIILIPLSILFPTVASVAELGHWSLITVLSLPILPLVILLAKFLPDFFNRTAK